MKTRDTIILIALCAVLVRAHGQNEPQSTSSSPSCKAAQALLNTDLFGAWSLLLEGAGTSVVTRLHMQRNPEYAESLAGQFQLGERSLQVFGDIEEGQLELEESANGKDISALWKGRVVEGSCGQTIMGNRRNTVDNSEQSFVLRRPGW
jgi:hypothetical protein